MSELATLARPYAEAVFKRAKESENTQEWSDDLKFLAIVMKNNELAAASDNPRIDRSSFTDLLLGICKGQISGEGSNLVRLLIENNRLKLASHISELYEAYRADEEGYVDAHIKTAYPLTKTAEQQLSKILEKTLNKKVQFQVEKDSSLIGGVLIRAGDMVIDASVRGQLQTLAKRLYT